MKDARRRQVHRAQLEQDSFSGAKVQCFLERDLPATIRPRYREISTVDKEDERGSDNENGFFHALWTVGNGDYFVVTGSRLKFFNAHTLECVAEFAEHLFVNLNNTATISDDVIAIVCSDPWSYNYLYTFNVKTCKVISVLRLGRKKYSLSGIVSLDGNTLVCGDFRRNLYVVRYDSESGKIATATTPNNNTIYGTRYNSNNTDITDSAANVDIESDGVDSMFTQAGAHRGIAQL